MRRVLVLFLSRRDVEDLLTMKDTIQVVEEAFREFALGSVLMPQRQTLLIDEGRGWVGVMPSYIGRMGALATKIVTVYKENPSQYNLPTTMATILLNDPRTGEPKALMEGGSITSMRTGAISAVATKYLSRRDSQVLGLFGAGVQAESQVAGLCEVRGIRLVKVYDPYTSRMKEFVEGLSSRYGVEVRPVEEPREAVVDSDIITTATTSRSPVFDGGWLAPGTHVNSIGSHTPEVRELDTKTVKASKLVVDSKEACLREAGDLVIPLSQGELGVEEIYGELGEVVAGVKRGRESDSEITVFKSVGLAIQDASTALLVYRRAVERGVGVELKI